MSFSYDVCVVGGCGRAGLPLALAFAEHGLNVCIHDINDELVGVVNSGKMPFLEQGADEVLRRVLGRTLTVVNDPVQISLSQHVIVVIGTPVDEHLNPTYHAMRRFFDRELLPNLVDGQCVILRSTVFPGTTSTLNELVLAVGKGVCVSFCPERVAEGQALRELTEQPQIVSGCDERALEMAAALFGRIAKSIVKSTPSEAELSKIFTNVWRYIQFATANQFFMMAAEYELDFYRIYDALTRDYPRMAALPASGFAAGPSLFKDTMQLAAAYNNTFALGHAAMLINEGLPNFIVRQLKSQYPLAELRVGILGMAYKANSDDPRESLSYKLRKVLEYEAAEVLCTDVYIEHPSFKSLAVVLEESDLLILGVPHKEYRSIEIPETTPVIDIWNYFGKGASLKRVDSFVPRSRAPG
jgi:UDP-N-acetyl-D-mannosaminuronic acid dehydrogenase